MVHSHTGKCEDIENRAFVRSLSRYIPDQQLGKENEMNSKNPVLCVFVGILIGIFIAGGIPLAIAGRKHGRMSKRYHNTTVRNPNNDTIEEIVLDKTASPSSEAPNDMEMAAAAPEATESQEPTETVSADTTSPATDADEGPRQGEVVFSQKTPSAKPDEEVGPAGPPLPVFGANYAVGVQNVYDAAIRAVIESKNVPAAVVSVPDVPKGIFASKPYGTWASGILREVQLILNREQVRPMEAPAAMPVVAQTEAKVQPPEAKPLTNAEEAKECLHYWADFLRAERVKLVGRMPSKRHRKARRAYNARLAEHANDLRQIDERILFAQNEYMAIVAIQLKLRANDAEIVKLKGEQQETQAAADVAAQAASAKVIELTNATNTKKTTETEMASAVKELREKFEKMRG